MSRRHGWVIGVLVLAGPWSAEAAESGKTVAVDAVVAAVRRQGFPCASLKWVERDTDPALGPAMVWFAQCVEGRYRVIFAGSRRTEVYPVDDPEFQRTQR
jgi:hypothetical protein